MEMVKDALDQLRGAVMIVYPMGLPPYDPIRMEFENKEDLSGTQVCRSGICQVSSLPKEQEPLRSDPPLPGGFCSRAVMNPAGGQEGGAVGSH